MVVALDSACGSDKSVLVAGDCIKVVEESGQITDECLPLAPDSERVDLATPTFSQPTQITNRLHPTSQVKQVIMGGQVDGKPFRTEVTLLPGSRAIPVHGKPVDTTIIQYAAYLDGRMHEVAIDWYAQADDGSVWYFGEDVFNYEDGRVADTKGTWVAGDQLPPAMIMPAEPRVGNVYRSENAPGIAFEQISVDKVDQQVAGPSGKISGAMEVTELHMDNTTEEKTFAPGYGEFATGSPGGDLEAVSLATPTDTRQGPAPAEYEALSKATDGLLASVADNDAGRVRQAAAALDGAWAAVLTTGVPPRLQAQMATDIESLNNATAAADWPAAQTAALRIAQNHLDLRLLHDRVIDVELARLALWTRQLPVDVAADEAGFVLADVAALERVWERTRPDVQAPAAVDTAIKQLRTAADAGDLSQVDRAAITLKKTVAGLIAR